MSRRTMGDLDALRRSLSEFADERGWTSYHAPKNLAMAVAGEAGELLAELQWVSTEGSADLPEPLRRRVCEEAADVFIYLLHLEAALGMDLVDEAEMTLRRNATRFPADVRSRS